LERKRNEGIVRELQILQISEYVEQYKRNWIEHTDWINSDRIKKKRSQNIKSKLKINLGRPIKRMKDSVFNTSIKSLKTYDTGKVDDDDDDNDDINYWYYRTLQKIIKTIKLSRMRWTRHLASKGEAILA
jgi:fructose-1,6-bisphosphatase